MTEPAVPLPERPGIMPVKERGGGEGERERGREGERERGREGERHRERKSRAVRR
jgi:hypothetical protein